MSSVTNVGIKLTLDGAAQAEDGLRRVQQGIQGIGGAAETVRGALGSLAGAFAGVVSVRAFVQAADAVTQLQNQLRLATGSTQAATAAYQQLFEIAQRSRVSFTELGSTFASISRASESLGLSQQQLLKLTETIGNAITVGGQSAQASQAALTQLSQGLASGVLRGEELNSILEQAPRLARALADGLGVSTGALREMGKEGELTAERVIGALQSQASVLANEVTSSVVTVGQAFTQLQNSATALVGEIDRVSGSSATLAGVVQAASESLDGIARAFRDTQSAGQQVSVFADAIAVVFETVAVLGVNVAYVIKQIGTEIGGLAAQAAAVARLDFSAAREIGRMMREDAAAARREVDALSERILNSRRLAERGVDTREQADGVRKVGAAAADTKKRIKELGDEFAAQRDAAKAWADAYQDFTRIAAQANAESLGLTKAQARLVEFLGSPAYANASEPMRQLALEQAYAAITAEQIAAAQERQAKALEAAAKAEFERIEAVERNAASAKEQLQRLLDEEKALTIAAEKNISLAQALEEVAIARLREQQAALMREGDRDAEVLAIQREIDARKKLAEAIGRKEARDAAAESAREAEREWQRTAENIERSLTDALMRGFESGKDFARVLRDTIVNMFQTLVLQPTISAVLSPVSTAINGVVSSGLSALGIGGQAASMAGLFGVGGGATAASFAQNVATGVSVGLSSSEAIAAATAAGQAMGASAGAGFAASLSAVPGWGWALGGVALLGGLLGGGGETRQGGQYRLDGGRAVLVAGPSGGEIEGQAVRAAIDATADGINTLLKQLGSSASLAAFQAGLESSDNSRGGVFAGGTLSTGQTFGMSGGGSNYDGTMYDPSFGFSGDSKAMLQAFTAELAQTTLQALQAATDIPKAVRDQLDAVDIKGLSAEAATALATSIAQQAQDVATFREAMESLPFENLRNLSYDAAAALGTAAGGLGTLAQSLTSFANNTAFYTQAEIDARVMAELTATFAEFGQEMPTTTAEFRALVEHVAALAPTSEGAAKGLAALLASADAFARIAANAANAISNAASSAQSAAFSASNQPADLAELQARFAAYNVAAPTNMVEYRALMAQAAAAAPTDAIAAQALAELEASVNTASQLFTDAAQAAAPNWGPSFQNAGGGGASEKALADWKSATDSIKSTMDDLRKTLIDETKPSLAALQAEFAVAVAQAKAGDAMAAASLPDLAKAISAAGREQASSALEAALITARAAQALQDVLDARSVASAAPSYIGIEGTAAPLGEPEPGPNPSGRTWLTQPEIDENMRYAQVSIQHYLDWYVPWMQSQMLPPDRASAPNPVMEPDSMYIFTGGNGPGGNATEIADALAAMAERLAAIEAATQATQNATRSTADVLERASRGSQPLATQVTP